MSENSKTITLRPFIEVLAIMAVFFAGRALGLYFDLTFAGSVGVFFVLIVLFVFYRPLDRYGLKIPKSRRQWFALMGLGALIFPVVGVSVNFVVMPFMAKIGLTMPNVEYFNFLVGEPLIFAFYIIVIAWIAAGFGEELFMRGFVMTKIAQGFGNGFVAWSLAVVLQAILFGVLHGYQGAAGMLMTGTVGFIMGVFYLIGGRSLVPVVIAHAAIDTLSLTQIFLSGDGAADDAGHIVRLLTSL